MKFTKEQKRYLLGLAGLLIALLVLAAGCGKKTTGGQAGRPEGGEGLPVSVVKAFKGELETATTISGKLEAATSANIVAKTPGKVKNVYVDVGSRVSAGQVLVELENSDQEAALIQAEVGVEQAQINLDKLRIDYERNKELLEAGAIARSAFETIETQYKLAEVALKSAQAQLQKAQTAYADTFIRAPFSGEIVSRNINPGELASTALPLFNLVNLDPVAVKVMVSEDLVNKLKVGQKVKVKVTAVQSEPFEGTITNIAAAADPTSKSFPVKIQISNPRHLLKPGMFAEVSFNSGQQSYILVPREAVVKSGDKDVVWVVQDGVARKREVKVGPSDGKHTAILEGVQENEMVIVAGQESLQDGSKVQPKGSGVGGQQAPQGQQAPLVPSSQQSQQSQTQQ